MSNTVPESIDAALLRALAALSGVELSEERAAALVEQAGPHFAHLRALAAVTDPTVEPAAVFRLDEWVGRDRA